MGKIGHVVSATCVASVLALSTAACTPGVTTDIPTQIATADSYVQGALTIADTCVALHLPICSSPAVIAGIATARQVAEEALAEAKAFPVNGTTQDKISAALRVAMNAVLMFYSFKGG